MMGVVIFMVVFLVLMFTILIVKETSKHKRYKSARADAVELLKSKGFHIEKEVGFTAKLYVDNVKKLWAVKEYSDSTDIKIYKYSDLVDFELLEDNESLVKGGFGKALVGGAIGGTTGAVIGSAGSKRIKQKATLLEIKIRVNDFEHPQYSIEFIKGFALPKDSSSYRTYFDAAQEMIGVLNYIANNGEVQQKEAVSELPATESLGDRLRELNQLKNEGIITSEEFEAKKKELLNL